MKKIIQKTSRDQVRNITLIVCALLMALGYFFKTPFVSFGYTVFDNTFLAVGAIGMLLVFGVVQLVKAYKGGGETKQ